MYNTINNGDTGSDVRSTLNGMINELNNEFTIYGTFSVVGDTTELALPTIDLSSYTGVLIEGVLLAQEETSLDTYGNQFYIVYKVVGGELTLVSTADQYIKKDFATASVSFDTSGTNLDIAFTGEVDATINGTCKVKITKI